MEYFVTCVRTILDDCHNKFGVVKHPKNCSEFESEPCPADVLCKMDFDEAIESPADPCPVVGCSGKRPFVCIKSPCGKYPSHLHWRCSLGELPCTGKKVLEVFEKKLQAAGILERYSQETLTLCSSEQLNLSDPNQRDIHYELIAKYDELEKTCLDDYSFLMMSASQQNLIAGVIECRQYADKIREGEAKYTKQPSYAESSPVNNAVAATIIEIPDATKGRWVSLDEAVEIRNVKKKTLELYRSGGITNPDGLSGKDSQGFFWKRDVEKGRNAATKYFIPLNFKPVNPHVD